jgi:HEAT repeat protein
MSTVEIEALFARTLVEDYDSEDAHEAIRALHSNGNREVFERAAAWCVSDDPLKRARGAAILSQLFRAPAPALDGKISWRNPEFLFRDESYSLVTRMLEIEQDPQVLLSGVNALGHLNNPAAIPLILRYANHPDEDVRFQVSFALGCFPNDPQSVSGLLELTSDVDEDVRDWAAFGLGVLGDADTSEIRETLLRCLDDENEDVREEATVGLGKRQEPRLLPRLLKMLDQPRVTDRVTEAAAGLLGLYDRPPKWCAGEYKAALKSKFQIAG